jgi:hypothetical protein
MGMWFTDTPQGKPDDTAFFGGSLAYDGVGAIIDTSTRPAKVRLMLGTKTGNPRELCSCDFIARNIIKMGTIFVELTYREKTLTLVLNAEGSLFPTTCCRYEEEPVTLPAVGYWSITARNGGRSLAENVDVYGVKVMSYTYMTESERVLNFVDPRYHHAQELRERHSHLGSKGG